jgi:hypothetical protein
MIVGQTAYNSHHCNHTLLLVVINYKGKTVTLKITTSALAITLSALILSSAPHVYGAEPSFNDAGERTVSTQVLYANQRFSQFEPKPNANNRTRLDYSIWNDALSKVVVDLGPSTRLRAKRPSASVGTRFVRGHKSAYRLEGSRFTFEYITDDFVGGLSDYRKDLQDIATNYDISRFSKNEQLAFWLNLYNVATLEKIAEAYPVQRPDYIKIEYEGQEYELEEAPFLRIKGQSLSLKDIRENIVYRYWKNPLVIYGFFRGEIGSPLLQSYAFTGETVEQMLTQNADDFVNSLRGFNLGSRTRNVSDIYNEAGSYFFPDFEKDLIPHLMLYANDTVKTELAKPLPVKIDSYDNMIADLSGGRRLGSSGAPTGNLGPSVEVTRLLREANEKREYLNRRRDSRAGSGYVIIEDLVPEEDKQNQPLE